MTELRPASMSPAPRLEVWLWPVLVPSVTGRKRRRKLRLTHDSGLLDWQAGRFTERWAVCQASILQSLGGLQGTSLVSCHHLGIVGLPLLLWPWRGLREIPLPGMDWLLVPGSEAAPKDSMKWHQCVDKRARGGKFKKGWFSSLQSSVFLLLAQSGN